MANGTGQGSRIKPRGALACWRALENAHVALGRDLIAERLPDLPTERRPLVWWEPCGRRCPVCGKRMSHVLVDHIMVEPETHCLECAGHWPDLIVDWGQDVDDQCNLEFYGEEAS